MSVMNKIFKRSSSHWIFVLLLVCLYMYMTQRSLIYFPPPVPTDKQVERMTDGYKKITVETMDGYDLEGYFHAPALPDKPVIIVFHGNAALAAEMPPFFADAVEAGYGVLLVEYRGYANNSGSPSEEGLYQDANAFFKWAQENPDLADRKIVLYGQSLGTAVAIELAVKEGGKIAGLILEMPFLSAYDVAHELYPYVPFLGSLMKDKYLSSQKIGLIDAPKLFLLAAKNDVAGLEGGKKLYGLAKDPKTLKVYANATHDKIYEEGAGDDIATFLREDIQ